MQTTLVSFDGTESIRSDLRRPDRYRHLVAALQERGCSIPRGAGLTYCAASAGQGVRSISGLAFNRILSFDAQSGQIEVEPGIRLGELYRFVVPRGWMLPILPGHPSITVGGCVGCNVHGKNHVRDGSFVNVVESLRLFHPDHGELECSRQKNHDVFQLTLGGFGLTGFVTSVRLRLRPLTGTAVQVTRQPVKCLAEAADLLESRSQSDLLYSWHDFNLRGSRFGRGFLFVGRSIHDAGQAARTQTGEIRYNLLRSETRGRIDVGRMAPWITRAAAGIYGLSQQWSPAERVFDLASASFPINGKEIYFKLFGRRGFREYQLLVPRARWPEACDAVRLLIAENRASIGLASLKLFESESEYLRFDGKGICLSLDAPAGERTSALFAGLDALTERIGGIVNLSKDSRISGRTAGRIFSGYDAFRAGLAQFDPQRRLDSALRRRLDV